MLKKTYLNIKILSDYLKDSTSPYHRNGSSLRSSSFQNIPALILGSIKLSESLVDLNLTLSKIHNNWRP